MSSTDICLRIFTILSIVTLTLSVNANAWGQVDTQSSSRRARNSTPSIPVKPDSTLGRQPVSPMESAPSSASDRRVVATIADELSKLPSAVQRLPQSGGELSAKLSPLMKKNPHFKADSVRGGDVQQMSGSSVTKVSHVGSSRRSHRIPSEAVRLKGDHPAGLNAVSGQPLELRQMPPQAGFAQSENAEDNPTIGAAVAGSIGKPQAITKRDAGQSEQLKPMTAASKSPDTKSAATEQDEAGQPERRVAKKLEPIRTGKQPRNRLPKLANPEQYRVSDASRKFHQDFQEQAVLPDSQEPKFRGYVPESLGGKDDPSWTDKLPIPSLDGGIRKQSMGLASQYQSTPSFVNFAQTAQLGMDYRIGQPVSVKTWRSPNFSHRPIYFEDENLERYGNGVGRMQPLVSGTKFFATALLLPYHVGAQHPSECVYEMGYFRPGDCNPAYRRSREISRRGVFNQLMTFGLVFGGL